MDVISAVASLLTLIQATSRVVDFLSDLKDGGRERMRLLAEVSGFCCALDNLKDLLENNRSSCEINDKADEKWTKEVHTLLLRGGVLEQCNGVFLSLEKRLAPQEGKARVIQHLRWPFSKAEVLQAVEQLHRLQTIINNLLSQVNISLSQQIRHDGVISRQILEDQKAQDIRSWLSPLDFAAQQEATFAGHCPGTGARFLQSQEYKVWKTSTSSTMWCLGVPGAGKTYLSSIVVHELEQEIELSADIVLVVYCRYDDPQCQSIANIAGDLLRQCIRNRQMPEALVNLFRGHRSSAGVRPTYDALFSILSDQLGLYRKVYIVVDALDEMAFSDDRRLLLESLRSTRTDLSLIITSRELEDIKSGIGLTDSVCDCCVYNDCSHCRECPRSVEYLYQCRRCIHPNVPSPNTFDLCQQCYEAGARCLGEGHKMEKMPNSISFHVELDEDDLKRYLQWRMASDSSLKGLMAKRAGLQDQVLDAVLRSSGSMFLMAKLILDGLATCLTIKEVKLALVDIPFGLPIAYNATMQRIIDQGPSRFCRAFEVMKWVLFAKRPLSSTEIEHTVGIEHGSEDIDLDNIVPATTLASLCAGLIVIDGYGKFRFIHQTVPEYLIRYHSEKFVDAEAWLADGCLTYIRYTTFMEGPCRDVEALEARHLRYPAYSYCTHYWYEHLYGTPSEEQKQVALQIFRNEPYWRSANQVTRGSWDDVSGMLSLENDTVLHYAAFLNAHLVFDDLMRLDSKCLNTQDSLGQSPLMVAACRGNLKIASRLLGAGAQVDTLDNYGHNALHIATFMDRKDLIPLLLANPRVNVDALTARRGKMPGGRTAVILAAREGYVIILSRLLKAGAEINRLDNHGISALHAAAIEGHSHIVDLLIATPQTDINIRAKGPKHSFGGESSLFNAARNGHVSIVTSLITAGATLNIVSDEGNTALHVAVEAGHVAVVEALVKSGMDVDLPQGNKYTGRCLTAVMLASLKGNLDILDIVLKHSRDINLRSVNGGRTALLYAIRRGNVDAVKLLLSYKTIEIELADDDGGTPLTYAAVYGRAGIIPELVTRGANLNGPTVLGETPIMIAVRQNQTEATKALLSLPGGDVNAVSRHEGRAPLHDAVSWGNAELVELLISHGADVRIRDKINDFTPLDYARYFNDGNILGLLKVSEAESRMPPD